MRTWCDAQRLTNSENLGRNLLYNALFLIRLQERRATRPIWEHVSLFPGSKANAVFQFERSFQPQASVHACTWIDVCGFFRTRVLYLWRGRLNDDHGYSFHFSKGTNMINPSFDWRRRIGKLRHLPRGDPGEDAPSSGHAETSSHPAFKRT